MRKFSKDEEIEEAFLKAPEITEEAPGLDEEAPAIEPVKQDKPRERKW